mgnify:CR=1 FL=1
MQAILNFWLDLISIIICINILPWNIFIKFLLLWWIKDPTFCMSLALFFVWNIWKMIRLIVDINISSYITILIKHVRLIMYLSEALFDTFLGFL